MPACQYPGCRTETDGCKIQDIDVCLFHINWAMGQAIVPIDEFRRIFSGGDDHEPRSGDTRSRRGRGVADD